MRVSTHIVAVAGLLLLCGGANAQFNFNPFRQIFRPVQQFFGNAMHAVGNLFSGGRFVDDGTQSPQATGIDSLFPDDCGRDPDAGTGKLCFPDGILCRDSKSIMSFFPYIY